MLKEINVLRKGVTEAKEGALEFRKKRGKVNMPWGVGGGEGEGKGLGVLLGGRTSHYRFLNIIF